MSDLDQKLLIPEPPMVVLPSLAQAIGIDEAIVLQQLHYWIQKSAHVREGRRWVYNSYADWGEQFPWISTRSIRRIFHRLEELGLVSSANLNRKRSDQTKWYTINYEALPGAEPASHLDNLAASTGQNSRPQPANLAASIPETTTETTPETKERPPIVPRAQKGLSRYQREMFDIFWERYPRKQAKLKAEEAWAKICPSRELLETILQAIEMQEASRQWSDGFVPYPATWLNGHRWEDEVAPVEKPGLRPNEQPVHIPRVVEEGDF